ncbi:MAG: hypothetical protein JWN44_1675 [Myxococcales bacterium]|nr:hypothetical protein [Myxococcales bacterium]
MRQLLVAFVLVVTGCTTQGLPIDNGSGTGGGVGGNGGGAVDMARPRDLGGTGAKCMTACDCQAGLACRQGTCGMSQVGPVYCCDEGQCPAGQFCQDQQGGFGQCGQSGGTGGGSGQGGGPGGGGGGQGGGPGGGGGGQGGGPGGGGGGGGGIPIPDGGAGNFCGFVPCTSDATCTQLGCARCGAGANGQKVCAAK